MRSLKARLIGLWGLSILSSVVLGLLLVSVFRQSSEAQLGRTQAVLALACDLIRDRYSFYTAGGAGLADDPATRRDLTTVVQIALARQAGVQGGIWSGAGGSLADAAPTGGGGAPFSAAETAQLSEINAAALREDRTVSRSVSEPSATLLLAACPLEGPITGVTAWTRARVGTQAGLGSLQTGLIALLVLLLLISVLLGRTLAVWGRQIGRIEATLGREGEAGLPPLARSGERELDRIVDALNLAGARLAQARRDSDAMAERVARAERLAALGRVAAGVAHEIRNPLAAARLQGENALAGDDRRRAAGIADMIEQLDRLDGLVSELLAMTQRVDPAPEPTDLPAFLAATAARHGDAAAARCLTLTTTCEPGAAALDPAIVCRILDNLMSNAIRHAAPNGTVTLAAARRPDLVAISVSDDGAGVPPAMTERLFEPFVTGRADGTGLGLAIARELADAHGGRLLLAGPTTFVLELPQETAQEAAWPRS